MVNLYALSYALLSPVIAGTTANWPRRRLLLTGLAMFTFGNLLNATGTSLPLVLVSRVVAGLGGAMYSPTATAGAASLVPTEQRGRALSIVVFGLSGATALGAPLGTALSGFGGWRVTMGFVTVVGALASLFIWRFMPVVLLVHWSAATFPTAAVAIIVWGICGWGLLVPQQHRLSGLAPAAAPLLLGLNAAFMYTGISAAAIVGGGVITWEGAGGIGYVGALLVAAGLVCA